MDIILVRHGAVAAEPDTPSVWWPLSDLGRAAARALARDPLWGAVEQMYSSPEYKAHETAQILAGPNGINVSLVGDLREVARPGQQWFDARDGLSYTEAVRAWFAAGSQPLHGWEPPAAARRRITACIARLYARERSPFAVVGHGLTLSLLVAEVTGVAPAEVWPSMTLPDIAVLDPARRVLRRPFGVWARESGITAAVPAVAPTAWQGDART